jgi:predicted dehydrogenase
MQWNGHQAKVFHERLCVFGSDVHLHDNQTVQIDYAGGARGSYVECFFTPEYRVEHQVIGDRGQMNIRYFVGVPHIELELLEIGSTRREVLLPVGEESSHGGGDTAMVREFCEAVRQGRPADPDLLAGYRAVALAKAIDASGESRRPETVAEDP